MKLTAKIAIALLSAATLSLSATALSAQPGARSLGGLDARFDATPVEDLYPWNDLRWRRRLYGIPYSYPYFYQPVCGYERMPYGVGKKIRWRVVFRCH